MNELISVIINVYNGEKFIGKCLKSIVDQTYQNLEILIINDGSTDNTLKICESYNDERIRIISQRNMGLSKARNIGIENAKGDWLYFIDADDFVDIDVIDYLYNIAKEKKMLISTCKPLVIKNYNYELKKNKETIEVISGKDMVKKILMSVDCAGTIWNKLIKKEMFNSIKFEDRIINDVVVVYKLYIQAGAVGYSNQEKYFYLQHSDSILGLDKDERIMDFYKGAKERYEYIKNIYPDFDENELSMYYLITNLYIRRNNKIRQFLKKEEAFKFYNKIFELKIISRKMKFSNKIKYIFFRISPELCRKAFNLYSLLKYK